MYNKSLKVDVKQLTYAHSSLILANNFAPVSEALGIWGPYKFMEEFKTILLSVFAGVITTVLIYGATLFLKYIVLPWYQRIIYKGVDVSGQWQGEQSLSDNISIITTLNLEQNAHDLSGTFTIIKMSNGEQERITNMSISGEIWEGFLSLKCRTISNKNLSFGSMLCKIVDSNLVGEYIFRNLAGNGSEISGISLSLMRKNA